MNPSPGVVRMEALVHSYAIQLKIDKHLKMSLPPKMLIIRQDSFPMAEIKSRVHFTVTGSYWPRMVFQRDQFPDYRRRLF